MSYREYTYNGHITRRRDGGHRFTAADYLPEPPNGSFWEGKAKEKLQEIADRIGTDNYKLWAEIVWPGDSIDCESWKEIYQTACDYIGINDGIYQMLECTCRPDSVSACAVCQATQRLNGADNVPY